MSDKLMKLFVEDDGTVFAVHDAELGIGPDAYADAGRDLTMVVAPKNAVVRRRVDLPGGRSSVEVEALPDGWREAWGTAE